MLQANTAGLHSVSAGLAAAARTLAQLGAQPTVHTPLAADETSMSVAARFSAHGVVMASRASDGAAVLDAAAQALAQAAIGYAAMDDGNQAVVGLQGNPAPPTPVATPAVTADLIGADVPIGALSLRPAEVTAAILEAGQPGAGAPFATGCAALSEGFSSGAVAARSAAGAVTEHLHGTAGPRITAALTRYAEWSQAMSRHADDIRRLAGEHQARFAEAQHATPTTTDFANRHRELQNAIAINSARPGPGSAAAVSRAHGELTRLINHTRAVATGYHIGELPATLPGPPSVVPIVQPGGGQMDSPTTTPENPAISATQRHSVGDADDPDTDNDDLENLAAAAEDPATNPLGDVGAQSMASALPSMMTGMLGGAIRMAASIPEKLGQQVQGVASQAVQGVGGLASRMASGDGPDGAASEPGLGDTPTGAAGGDEGVTAPTAGGGEGGDGKPRSAAMYGMGSPVSTSPPLAGYSGDTSAAAPPAAAGMGGAPMFMPPMGAGMGGGGGGPARNVKDPDKSIVMPSRPNSERVKGEGRDPLRHTATVDDADYPRGVPKRSVTVRSRGRRIESDQGGETT